uniref:Macrophage mannose receptor 1-like n=1 Tax=Geotrypetes seraphini TaxID=260995 RepID=A0A6P8PI85_GEOSA|nr:macrophage mannose receptor 1-like [Geotrypetes seraphini]
MTCKMTVDMGCKRCFFGSPTSMRLSFSQFSKAVASSFPTAIKKEFNEASQNLEVPKNAKEKLKVADDITGTAGVGLAVRCPNSPGWQKNNNTCYLISTDAKNWSDARDLCRKYRSTELIKLETMEEKSWIASKGLGNPWIGLNAPTGEGWRWADSTPLNGRLTCVPSDCLLGLSSDKVDCNSESTWICKKSPDGSFFEIENMLLISNTDYVIETYKTLYEASGNCVNLMEKCTGIVDQEGVFYTVNGGLLAQSITTQVKLHVKADCKVNFYGFTCDPCPPCPGNVTCNPWTGLCDNKICEEVIQAKCRDPLSEQCPSDWLPWQDNCYYVEKAQRKTWPEARLWCRHFLESDLVKMETNEEKDHMMTLQTSNTWVGLHHKSTSTGWTWADGKKVPTAITGQGSFSLIILSL